MYQGSFGINVTFVRRNLIPTPHTRVGHTQLTMARSGDGSAHTLV